MAVPFGLGANRKLDRLRQVGVSLARAAERREHVVPGLSLRFSYWTAWSRIGQRDIRTVHLPHPSSLRRPVEDRQRIVDTMAATLSSPS